MTETEAPSKWVSRKFALALLSLIALAALCWAGKIDGGQFITGLVATVGAYMAANVTQKATAKAA